MVGHIRDRVFVAPVDIGDTLLVDAQPYGCFILDIAFLFINKLLKLNSTLLGLEFLNPPLW